VTARRWLALLAFALAVVLDPPALAADQLQPRFGRKRQQIGLVAGFGYGKLHRRGSPVVSDVMYVPIYPRWSIGITNPLGGDSWYRGNVDIVLEGTFFYAVQPKGGYFAGATGGLRYNFLRSERFVPFIDLGAGVGSIQLNLRELSDGIGFPLYAGGGAHAFVSPTVAVTMHARWQHLSNGGLNDRNESLNDGVFLIGLTYFLR
jgi:hypothetical protein